MENLTSRVIKGYELREPIGEGGMGAVYKAYQSTIGREVAIKIILPRFANHPDFIRRFETEAQLIARLEHPYIIPLYDYWREPDGAYLVMRWLRGGSLRDALRDGTFDVEATALLLDQITAALAVAHRNHIIHRDLKPANILLDEDGNAYLADFGIAKDLGSMTDNGTQADAMVGSLDYLSPEQARSQPVTPQTDIYTLGVILYEVLTGQHPFPNITPVEQMYKHLNEPLPVITNLNPDLGDAVNTVIQRATAKNPVHRYPDALALAVAFREAVGLNRGHTGDSLIETLTQREHNVLQCIIDGRSNKEIAQELFITPGTVKWYIRQIYAKLNVRSRMQAILPAQELKLIRTGETGEIQPIGNGAASVLLPEPENPYKGLRAFQTADARDFFGREALIDKLIKRLANGHSHAGASHRDEVEASRFLAVVGPSGSGKSSLVKAGLVLALGRGALPGSDKWFIVEMLPGARPLAELEIALLRIAANQSGSLNDLLQRDRYGLVNVAHLILPNDGSELVLVIDQFEELFTLVENESTRTQFLDLLHAAVTDPRSRVRVILTLRADFYDRPLLYPDFGELVRSRMETILPLTADGLERAIARPAEQVGVSFEPGLVAAIVTEVNYQPGALPLLQYALTELFERRDGRRLTREAYQAIGGTVGALAKRADEIYEELDDTGKEAARQMFLRLVTLGEGVEDTRRRVARSELLAIANTIDNDLMDDLIDTYTEYRLLSLDNDPGSRIPTVEVAHEAILREWERLRSWLNESRDEIRLQRQLAALAMEWREAKQDKSFLVSGSRLEQFETWAQDTKLALTPAERAYLDASLAERERQQTAEKVRQAHEAHLERRSRNFLRGLVAVLLVATLGAFGLTGVAVNQSNIAQAERDSAQTNFTRAERIRLAAQADIALGQGEDAIVPALLSLRSLQYGYSPEADAALLNALSRGFPRQQFIGHTDALSSVAISPDGHFVLTAANDATARLWDIQTGQETRRFTLDGQLVTKAIFSLDGTQVLTADSDGTVRLWDTKTAKEVRRYPTHDSPVWALAFSPDGKYILTSDESSPSAQLWNAQTGAKVREFIGHEDTINEGAFSPDGRYVATGSFDRTARLWDVATGEEVRRFEGHANCVCNVAFSPDGLFLLTGSYDNTARLWDVATGQEAHRFLGHTGILYSAIFSPDGRYVVTGSNDKTIRLWDAQTGQELHQFLGHTASAGEVAFSSDGRYVLTGSVDRTAKLWSVEAESEPRIFSKGFTTLHSATVLLVTFSPDGKEIITGGGNGMVRSWDIQTGQVTHETPTDTTRINSLDFSPDGKQVVTARIDGTARLWDTQTDEQVREFTGHIGAVSVAIFSPDGRLILTGGEDATARLWDAQMGMELRQFVGHTGSVLDVAFSSDNRYIVTASADATARLWDAQTGVELHEFVGHTGPIRAVALSADTRYVLTGSADLTARLWDVVTGQQVHEFVGHTDSVLAVAFSPDTRYVLTGGADLTARLWDVVTGQAVRQFVGHNDPVRSVAFSANGREVLTGDYSATYLWRTRLTDVIALACAQLPRDFSQEERALYLISDSASTCSKNN